MNVTATDRRVIDYNFTLSAQDLEKYLADPQAWADDVRAQLGLAAPAANQGPATKKAGGGRRAAAKARGAGASGRSTKSAGRQKAGMSCPVCHKPFKTQGRLASHLKKRHPEYRTSQ